MRKIGSFFNEESNQMRKIGSFFNEESNHYKMVWFLCSITYQPLWVI